ncbi:MAG: radical SAM protein [Verrucomicrobia bacterium]|nr:radical SAM protein [Verrucomicrobiota bacterium]
MEEHALANRPALGKLALTSGHPKQIKLYNAGSFFDPQAIPPEDNPAVADRVSAFARVIVECHPALANDPAARFRELLLASAQRRHETKRRPPVLEVAMGLETIHPQVLPKLNKRMSLAQFARAARFLKQQEIALRVFVLVQPPFLKETEALTWANRSVEFAFACDAAVVCLIPTRAGNGAMEQLARQGDFAPPRLATLEAALEHGLRLRRGRVLADLWNLEQFVDCGACFQERLARLRDMNLSQQIREEILCRKCDHG